MSLIIRHLTKYFADDLEHAVLSDINLEIEDHQFVCIVGPSGCGKSTLLNMIAGLDKPTSGEIELNGERVTGPGKDRVVMFQEDALFPWLTVEENIKLGLRFAKVDKEKQDEIATKYLKMVELEDYGKYPVHRISGGMKQRAALARSLALDSEILLMDEPFSALDKQTINILREELVKIWEETQKTIFFVTHSVEEAVFFADKVIVLSALSGNIKNVYPIDIERPRQIDNAHFVELRKLILEDVKTEARRNRIAKEN